MLNRIFKSKPSISPPPPAPPSGKKITVGIGAMHYFVRQVHREGIDRGCVASFGNTLAVEQTLTTDRGQVAAALMGVESKVLGDANEGTALYDSLATVGEQFARAADRPAVGVLLAVTDGKDVHSSRFKNDPTGAGRAYKRALDASPLQYLTVLIGVGADDEIDAVALARLADAGGMSLVTVDNMAKLGDVLAALGTQLTTGVVTEVVKIGRYAIADQRHVAQVSVVPFDYVILMDRSGRMANRA